MEQETALQMSPVVVSSIAIVLLLAITLHEAAHAWVADKLGDPTPRSQGRVSLNPIRHISFFGTILVPTMLILSGTGLVFGWAKPVLVEPHRFKNPKTAMMDVALAGPAINLLMAIIGCIGLGLFTQPDFSIDGGLKDATAIQSFFFFMILINTVLAVFNMFPLPPLDGSKVLIGILPNALARPIAQMQGVGFGLLIALMIVPMAIPEAPNIIFGYVAYGTAAVLGFLFNLFGFA
ncbi:MAG: site-2 protease family protein [Alphaproteobacteria bacterium]